MHNRLTMPGGVTKRDVPVWMNSGDVFLNTTDIDNTPVSVLEAMASGLCVVATNVGGVPYLVNHERSALIVAPDDVAAMTFGRSTDPGGASTRRNPVRGRPSEGSAVRLGSNHARMGAGVSVALERS